MTIYMVTSGEYSDYSINGVFSTKEKAQAYIDEYRKVYDYSDRYFDIETLELDHDLDKVAQDTHCVRLNTTTGNLLQSSKYRTFELPNHTFQHADKNMCYANAPTKELAEKLAAEARQAWLRENPPEIGKKNAKKEK